MATAPFHKGSNPWYPQRTLPTLGVPGNRQQLMRASLSGRETNMTRQNLRTLGALGVLFVLIAVVIGVFAPDGGNTRNASASGSDTEVSDALKDALTITTATLSCPESVLEHGGSTMASGSSTVVVFNNHIGALKGTPPRLWSDALTVPYTETEPVNMLGETQAEICFNPHYGTTVANFFANMSVGDVRIVDLNPWLAPFAGDASQINNLAAGYMPLLDVTDVTDEQAQEAVTQNIAWQQIAQRLGTLLTRFQVDGIRAEQSTLNYHLTGGGASVGGLPEVGLNPNQENLPSLMLKLTNKDACVPIKVIGFNVGDKRPEEFAPPTCETPAPPATTPPPRETTPTTRPTPEETTPTMGPTPTTTPTTTPTPTTVPCPSGKCTPPTTVAPPPTTAPPATTTTQPSNGGQGDSGDGATNTTSPPTTEAPAPAPDNTDSPTENPSGPPPG